MSSYLSALRCQGAASQEPADTVPPNEQNDLSRQ